MIWALVPTWLKRALAWAGVALAAIGAAWVGGKRSGAVKAKTKGLSDQVEAYEVRNEVENRIARDDDARQRLRERWERQE